MTRVFVYTPTYADLLQPETVASVEAMTFDGEWDWVVSDENPYPGRDTRNAFYQYDKGRTLALDGGYDAMLTVEHDMLIPPDALQTLWESHGDVVYGLYMLRHGTPCVNLFQHTGGTNLGMSLSLYPRELKAAAKRGWVEVSGTGFGCTLMRRHALERAPFRETDSAPDLPFSSDCLKRGLKQIGRMDVQCGHIDTDNDRTLWPHERSGYGMVARVLANTDVTVNDAGRSVEMKRGKYYSISPTVAFELQRAGYVAITNEADEVVAETEAETATDVQAEQRETAEVKTKRRRGRRQAPAKPEPQKTEAG